MNRGGAVIGPGISALHVKEGPPGTVGQVASESGAFCSGEYMPRGVNPQVDPDRLEGVETGDRIEGRDHQWRTTIGGECRRKSAAAGHGPSRSRRRPDQISGTSREEDGATGLRTLVRSNQSTNTVGDIPDTRSGIGVRGGSTGQSGDHAPPPAHLHL